MVRQKKDILNVHMKSEGINIFFTKLEFTIFVVKCKKFTFIHVAQILLNSSLPNFEKKLCIERSRDVLHARILLLVRYSQWTRTVTELPTAKGS